MNDAVPAPNYVVEHADTVRDREAVLGVWRGNLGRDERMGAKYDWFYRDNPLGPPLTLLLKHVASGAVVGVASAGPRRMRVDGRIIEAGVLVDLAVLPEHRTLGPALQLQQAMLDAAGARFALLYGLPNRKAVPVFKRVGYAAIAEMLRMARVLRHREHIARRVPGTAAALATLAAPVVDTVVRARDALRHLGQPRWRTTWMDAPPADLAPGAEPGLLRGAHDRAFQQWRFAAGPTPPARWLRVEDRTGTLRGWFTCQSSDDVLQIVDCGGADGQSAPPLAAILALLRAARARGHASVSLQLAAPEALLAPWRAAGFVLRSQRTVFGRWYATAPAQAAWFTAADEDE
jgi:GNAT superfamily N-acetyltransferase